LLASLGTCPHHFFVFVVLYGRDPADGKKRIWWVHRQLNKSYISFTVRLIGKEDWSIHFYMLDLQEKINTTFELLAPL